MVALQQNRLIRLLDSKRRAGEKALVAYIMAGEPDWGGTLRIVRELEAAGVAAVELGVPFSDPIADGKVIQAAAARALASGVTLAAIFEHVQKLRGNCALPILLMGYWNVFLRFGRERMLTRAREAGVDGLIIPDLPYEADPEFYDEARSAGLAAVLLATELTTAERLGNLARSSTGFVYYVPKLGITGQQIEVTPALQERIAALRALAQRPVLVGIGVKTREDVCRLWEVSDGVIVGTRMVDFIDRNRDDPDLPRRVGELARELLGEAGT